MLSEVPFWFVAAVIAPSFVTALVAAYFVRRGAPRWGLIDKPAARKVHVTPTPLGGGVAIWLAVVLPFAVGQVLLWLVASGAVSRDWLPCRPRAILAQKKPVARTKGETGSNRYSFAVPALAS